jgi:hypothetical protein
MAGFNVTLSNLSSPIGGVSGIGNSATTTPVVLTVAGGTSTFAGVLFNNLALTIDGGFLTLRGIGENSGPTTVNSGILSVTGSLPTTGSVIVNSGATLSGAMVGGAGGIGRVGNVTMEPGANVRAGATAADGSVGTLTMSTLTVNGGDMRFDLAGGGASDRITVVGTATFNAPSTITPSLVVPGTHTLLTADTLRGVAPRLNLPTGARATFALNFETLADQIRLIITGSPPKTLTWNGANGSEWDLNTTANWTDGAMAETFFNLDSVIFPDAAAIRNIVVNATVVPGSVLVNSSPGNDYTIAGSGSIGDSSFTGTTLMKRGGGTLTLGGTTAYHATMTIEEGLLRTTGSIVINNPVTIASSARLIIEGIASLAEIIGTGSTEVGNTTTAATLAASHVRQASLTIAAGSEVRTKPIGGTTVLGALNIAGPADAPTARFDLNNNAAVVNYAGTSPISTIRSQMLAGRGGAGLGKPWTGMGITSSAAAAAVAAEPESSSVGFAENATLPLGPYTTFRGQPVDDTSIVTAFTRTGDANLDGLVNDDDVTIVGATYAPGVPQAAWALGDFDYNGFVDDDDVTLLGAFYDPSAQPLAVSPVGVAAAVPEPAAVTLAVLAALFCIAAPSSRRCCRSGCA